MIKVIVAIDPGKEKCGFAVVGTDGKVLRKKVVLTEDLVEKVLSVKETVVIYALGDATAAGDVRKDLLKVGIPRASIVMIDEYKSSEIGRRQYWRENPPKGWRRLLPTSMQVPPEPYDDFVAVELARRYLADGARAGKRVPPS